MSDRVLRMESIDEHDDTEEIEFQENPMRRSHRNPPGYERSPDFSRGNSTLLDSQAFASTSFGTEAAPGINNKYLLERVLNDLPSQSSEARELQTDGSATLHPRLNKTESKDDVVGLSKLRKRYSDADRSRRGRSSTHARKSSMFEFQRNISLVKETSKPIADKKIAARLGRKSLATATAGISTIEWLTAIYSIKWRRFRQGVWDAIVDLQIWRKSIKELEGKNGAAVGTYFRYLRWAFLLNLFVGLLYVGFVMVPFQIIQGFQAGRDLLVPEFPTISYAADNIVLGLITGGGILNGTFYFLGSYTFEIDVYSDEPHTYDFALMYLLLTGVIIFAIFVLSLKELALNTFWRIAGTREGQHPVSEIVFSSYDYGITEKKAISSKQNAVCLALLEVLNEEKARKEFEMKNKRVVYAKRFFINIAVLIILGLCFWAISVTTITFSVSPNDLEQLIPALVLSLLNQTIPVIFEILSRMEEWITPLKTIQWTVVRSIVLRTGSLYAFFYTYFLQIPERMCWESFVGQQMYNVLVISFFVEIVTSSLHDPIRKLLYERTTWFRKYLPTARFQTIKCTLEMLWTQSMVWFGMYFCPVLPLVGAVKHFVLFYIKKFSTLKFCAPPVRVFRAKYSLGYVMSLMLLINVVTIAIPLGYTITNIAPSGVLRSDVDSARWVDKNALTGGNNGSCTGSLPVRTCADCIDASLATNETICFQVDDTVFEDGVNTTLAALCQLCPSGCGPYRNFASIYDIALEEFETWPYGVRVVFGYIGTVAFATILSLFFLSVIFLYRTRLKAQKRVIGKLQIERDLERLDKIWILHKWQITLDDKEVAM